jgi:acetyltransferase
VDAFLHVVRYHQVQALLMETPLPLPDGPPPDTPAVRTVVAAALAAGRTVLTEPESKAVLTAYDIPVVETRIVHSAAALCSAAEVLGYPVVLKILSPDITHKSDVGGVALNLATAEELERAAEAMLRRCRELRPEARLEGFTVQKMIRRGGAHEILAGIAPDPTFGPVIVFGRGGTAAEVIGDRAIGLPPLNSALARELISRTRISRLLAGARGQPGTNLPALEAALVRIAQLASDVTEIAELDINPLLADEHGVIALDARVRLAAAAAGALPPLAIRPYPSGLQEELEHRGRRLLLRPIRPEDTPLHRQFLAQITPQDLYTRFFTAVRQLPDADIAHLTQIDYDREMAFVALSAASDGTPEILGVARACADPDNDAAEFAVLVRSDLKGQGLGTLLMHKLIRYCRERGTRQLWGSVMSDNVPMLELSRRLGFRVRASDRNIEEIALDLQSDRMGSS